jgi:hypothetical protein
LWIPGAYLLVGKGGKLGGNSGQHPNFAAKKGNCKKGRKKEEKKMREKGRKKKKR